MLGLGGGRGAGVDVQIGVGVEAQLGVRGRGRGGGQGWGTGVGAGVGYLEAQLGVVCGAAISFVTALGHVPVHFLAFVRDCSKQRRHAVCHAPWPIERESVHVCSWFV